MSSRTRLWLVVVSAPVIAFVVIGGFLGKAVARDDAYQHLRVFEDVVSLIVNNYVEDVDVDRVMHGAMRGLAEGLDADSAYLTPEEVRQIRARRTARPRRYRAAADAAVLPARHRRPGRLAFRGRGAAPRRLRADHQRTLDA